MQGRKEKDTQSHNPIYVQLRTKQDVGFNFVFEENTEKASILYESLPVRQGRQRCSQESPAGNAVGWPLLCTLPEMLPLQNTAEPAVSLSA